MIEVAIVAAVGGAGLALMGQALHIGHRRRKFQPPGHESPVALVQGPPLHFPPVSGDPVTARFHIRWAIGEATHQWHSDNLRHAKLVWDTLSADRAQYPGLLEFFDGDHRRGVRLGVTV